MKVKEKITRITEADFFDAVFATLALRDCQAIGVDLELEKAMCKIFNKLTEYANQENLELAFPHQASLAPWRFCNRSNGHSVCTAERYHRFGLAAGENHMDSVNKRKG